MAEILKQSGDNFLVKGSDGKIREVKRDREGIKKGWYLQPNTEKDKFIETYGHHPTEDPKDVQRFLNRRGLGNKKYVNFR
jgi:hypothetical protein